MRTGQGAGAPGTPLLLTPPNIVLLTTSLQLLPGYSSLVRWGILGIYLLYSVVYHRTLLIKTVLGDQMYNFICY